MSDNPSNNKANGGSQANGNGADSEMFTVQTYAQFVRDFSFENPGAPDFIDEGSEDCTVDLQIGVDTDKYEDGIHEVSMIIRAEAAQGDKTQYLIELTYCGMFNLVNVPEDQIEEILRVQCANLLFPFARQIIADAARSGGYPPLLLNLIDFGVLYRKYHTEEGALEGEAAGEDQAG